MTELKRGLPPVEDVLALLNSAYDGWGDEEYFEWKYNEYPDYDDDEHVFYIESDDELVAYRRVFYKELERNDVLIPVFVHGDMAVGKPHRGHGHYSTLYSSTIEYCKQEGAQLAMAYNRKSNLSFKANRKRGWRYQDLPVNILILSPSTVIERNANLALADSPPLQRLLDIGGDRINIVTSDGSISGSALIDNDSQEAPRTSLDVCFSDRAVTRLVETMTNDGLPAVVTAGLASIAAGDISFGRDEQPQSAGTNSSRAREDVDVSYQETVSPTEIDEMLSLYDRGNVVSFRRDERDLDHLMAYPDATVLFARRNSELTGFAVVGTHRDGPVVEARVLELTHRTADDFEALVAEVKNMALTEGCDLVLLISERKPGNEWARIDMQTIVWDGLGNDEIATYLEEEQITVSLYDVV